MVTRRTHGFTGAVLAGGASTRFGRDKAQVVVEGSTMLARSVASLVPHCDVVLVVGSDASGSVAGSVVARVDDVLPGGGALSGLHAALVHAAPGRGWVLVAACDMPYLDVATWTPIVEEAASVDREGGAELVVVAESLRGLEPLAAAYRPSVADEAEAALHAGRRSLRGLIERLPHRVVPWQAFDGEGGRDPFINVNRPGDLVGGGDASIDGASVAES